MSSTNREDHDLDIQNATRGLSVHLHDDIPGSPTTVGYKSVPWTPAITDDEAIPNISLTRPRHWKYISEGGATIVFSYRGPLHPVFSNSVLRLRKLVRAAPPPELAKEIGVGNSDIVKEQGTILKPLEVAEEDAQQKIKARGSTDSLRSDMSTRSAHRPRVGRSNSTLWVPSDSESDWDEADGEDGGPGPVDQPDDPTIAFQTRVTSRLVPLCYLPRLETARVSRRWVEELARISEGARPEARRKVDGIDVSRRKAVLADDLVGWEGWAVEIKPKWAFLPNGTHLSEESGVYKLARCRFCMHAYHETKAGKERGEYCPLDLFSGEESRIEKALGGLWDTWVESNGTINNLKVFVRGKTVKPQSDPKFNQLEGFLQAEAGPEGMKTAFVKAIAPMLRESPLLGTLATLMRSLDALDIEGVEKLWKEAMHFPMAGLSPPIASGEDEASLADWERFVDEYLAHGTYVGSKEQYDPDHPREENLMYWLLSYLMGATFKDCSVMLRFPPGPIEGTFFNPEREVSMPLLTAIDLDPKSMKRLQKWADLDRDIVQTYAAADKAGQTDGKRCEDARVIGHVGQDSLGRH